MWTIYGTEQKLVRSSLMLQVAYGALIVTFLGAVHWGIAMTSTLGEYLTRKMPGDLGGFPPGERRRFLL
jgi:hypothetical protein